MKMVDLIVEYWVQIVFIAGALFYLYKQIMALKNGMKALLHDRIIQRCEYHIHKGYISSDDIDDLEYLNDPYKALGGNGTVKTMLHEVHSLPKGGKTAQEEK